MGGKIDCYIDCTSAYSQFALLHLRRNQEVLESHGVEVEFHPVFLGGINVGSGNQPPWTLPVKGKYLVYDRKRACKYFGVEYAPAPKFFPYNSVKPLRSLLYIKAHFPRAVYESTFYSFYTSTFTLDPPPLDISQPSNLSIVLHRSQHFSETQISEIIAAASQQDYKDMLTKNTKDLVEKGAFGCPWMIVRNGKTGKTEPFFGSDRWHFMWEFLGIPWSDVKIGEKGRGEAKL